jgi:hypothetical protein
MLRKPANPDKGHTHEKPEAAHLRILVFGPGHDLTEVAGASFEVAEGQASAK